MSQYFGTDPLDTAKKCFNDNTRHYVNANAQTNPEAFNLYNGLKNLAAAVEQMQRDIEEIKAHFARR